MIIFGAGGFAKEVYHILNQNNIQEIYFYDDINKKTSDKFYNNFTIFQQTTQAKEYFLKNNSNFIIGIGNPALRKKFTKKFTDIGGKATTAISPLADIGSIDVEIESGCIIMSGVKISNSVKIKKGTMIYYNTVITHDCTIGEFCEISPSVSVLGKSIIGNQVQIGAGSVIFPNIEIGENSIIAAGAIVRENVPDNVMVAGVPAKIKKKFI